MYKIDNNSEVKPMMGVDTDKEFTLEEIIDFCEAHNYNYVVHEETKVITISKEEI